MAVFRLASSLLCTASASASRGSMKATGTRYLATEGESTTGGGAGGGGGGAGWKREYGQLEARHLEAMKKIIGNADYVVTEEDTLAEASRDWMGKYKSKLASVVVSPGSTEEVSKILRLCYHERLPVVPQGGKTGLVGGGVPLMGGEVILSLRRLNRIAPFDPVLDSGIVECEAGTVLEQLDQFLHGHGYRVPLDLGAKGSCMIGGNLATNAGGTRFLRYGSLHANIIGMQVVLPDGTIVEDSVRAPSSSHQQQQQQQLQQEQEQEEEEEERGKEGGKEKEDARNLRVCNFLRKDNTGYDLKQLFVGSEGTLGIITRVALLCPPKLPSVQVAILGVPDFHSCIRAFHLAKSHLAEIISAFEFFDSRSLELVLKAIPGTKDPLPAASGAGAPQYPFYCLLETSGSNQQHDQEKLQAFLESSMESGVVLDGTLAQDQQQATQFWQLRETIAVALSKIGAVYKYDLSLPLGKMYDLVEVVRQRVDEADLSQPNDPFPITTVGYGHLGDANLHLNVLAPTYTPQLEKLLEPFVYQWTRDQRGSISAEHGLGQMKSKYLTYSKPLPFIHLMHQIKETLDPHRIMNPGKVFPL